MAASTLTSLSDPRIQQAYTDGGVDVLTALVTVCQRVFDQNPGMSLNAREVSDAMIGAMRAMRQDWPETVTAMAAAMARAAR